VVLLRCPNSSHRRERGGVSQSLECLVEASNLRTLRVVRGISYLNRGRADVRLGVERDISADEFIHRTAVIVLRRDSGERRRVKSGSWGTVMASYRLYCLDGAGHIGLAEWLEAEDDAEALALARVLKRNALKCEVWLDNRLVGSLPDDGVRPKLSLAPELHL
jgi:hypothetical protein